MAAPAPRARDRSATPRRLLAADGDAKAGENGGGISDGGQTRKAAQSPTELKWAHAVHALDLRSEIGTGQRFARGPALKRGPTCPPRSRSACENLG